MSALGENSSARRARRNISKKLRTMESNRAARTMFDTLLENCIFYISQLYEFSHRLGQTRSSGDVRCTTALPPKADVHPRSCYVAFVPNSDIGQIIRSPRRRWRAAPAGSFEPRGRQADHVCQ